MFYTRCYVALIQYENTKNINTDTFNRMALDTI
jgi:hypothetical protein